MLEVSKQAQRASSVTTLPIAKADLEKLESLYTFREREEVVSFLEEHPFLVPVLLEAPQKIEPYFADAPLSLKVYFDPEEDWSHLILLVVTQLDWETAFDKLDQLLAEWIVKLPSEILANLMIDTEP